MPISTLPWYVYSLLIKVLYIGAEIRLLIRKGRYNLNVMQVKESIFLYSVLDDNSYYGMSVLQPIQIKIVPP